MNIRGHVDVVTREKIIGWVMDIDRPESSVDVTIVVNGEVHGRIAADQMRADLIKHLPAPSTGRYQFTYVFDPPLSAHRAYTIEVLGDESRKPLPNGHRRLSFETRHTLAMSPIIITSSGRAGTTSLMRELDRQPSIAVANVYPYEHKVASYYATALRLLTSARSQTDDDWLNFAAVAKNQMHLVANPFNVPQINRNLGGEQLVRLFRDSMPERMANLFREMVTDFYGILAAHQNKPQARFFAEKCAPYEDTRQDIRWLFGEVRELVLVRDPRDYLCSAKQFWKQDVGTALSIMRSDFPILERIHESNHPSVMVVRYEDFVEKPVESRNHIYSFLGLDQWEMTQEQADEGMIQGHSTSSSPAASIGRWRQDLPAEEARACEEQLASYMKRFGYSAG